jgi:multidrug efflux pump subunit AcrA (membrane-fusion protein)
LSASSTAARFHAPNVEEGASSLESCANLKKDEVARSERLLRASLSGTIMAAVTELEDVQAEQSKNDAERSLKEMELETNEKALEKVTVARTAMQNELAEQEGT